MKLKHILLACITLLASRVLAAGTAAGVQIKLQSTATYVDGIGQSQSVSSNEVIVIVSEVYGFTLTANPDPLKVAPGNAADYSYLITNTGNAYDSFKIDLTETSVADADSVKVFYDANLNGQVDPGDSEIVTGGSTPIIAPDEVVGLIVQIVTKTTPSAALTNGANYDVDVDLKVTSNEDALQVEDRIDITVVHSDNEGVLDFQLTANTDAAGAGTAIEFTLFGSNTGEASIYGATGINVDGAAIAAGVVADVDLSSAIGHFDFDGAGGATTYAGITAGSIAPADGTLVFWDNGAGEWSTSSATTIDPANARVGILLQGTATEELLTVGQEFELTFTLNTLSTGLTDAVLQFDGESTYSQVSANTPVTLASNQIAINFTTDVLSTTSLATIRQFNDPVGPLTPADHPSITANPTGTLLVTTADSTSTGVRSAGEQILIPLTVENPAGGKGIDTYNITAVVNGALVSNVAIELLQADGVTPLQDTNSDSVRDTGEIATGGTKTIVARLILSESADLATLGAADNITITATTGGVSDTTTITIDSILPAGVDIAVGAASGDANAANDNPADVSLSAGESSPAIVIDVQNVRTTSTPQLETGDFDSYTLTYTAPAGVNVKFYEDLNGDGVLTENELQQILNTAPLSPFTAVTSNIFKLLAVVEATDSAAAGTNAVTVTATSTNNVAITDVINFNVTVIASPASLDLEPEIFATVVSGGNVVLSHTITNTGSLDSAQVTVTLTNPLPAGYTALWTDASGANLGTASTGSNDPGTLTIGTPTVGVSANSSVTIFLRVGVSSSTPAGETLTFEIEATDGTTTDSVTDVLQVIAGNLELVKEQREAGGTYSVALINTVSPGDGLDYRTTYENKGSSALTSVIIYETIPEHTELASATVTLTGDQTGTVEYSVDNATSFSATAPATIADTTNIRVTLNADLLPAQGGTVEYSVTIK